MPDLNTAGGGYPGWLTNVPATARTNQTGFVDAWMPYIQQFSSIAHKYQYPDGPIIGAIPCCLIDELMV